MSTSYYDRVRSSCKYVAEVSTSVSIDSQAVSRMADDILHERIEEWTAGEIHFNADAKHLGPLTCQYIFVLDALNFCFWPCEGLEYDTLAATLRNVLTADPSAFNGQNLRKITIQTLSDWFGGKDFPLMNERLDRIHELGYALEKR